MTRDETAILCIDGQEFAIQSVRAEGILPDEYRTNVREHENIHFDLCSTAAYNSVRLMMDQMQNMRCIIGGDVLVEFNGYIILAEQKNEFTHIVITVTGKMLARHDALSRYSVLEMLNKILRAYDKCGDIDCLDLLMAISERLKLEG